MIEQLHIIEARRHLPTAMLADLVANFAMGEKAPKFKTWLPNFAHSEPAVPEWVREDMRMAVEFGLARQDLYDAMRGLEE